MNGKEQISNEEIISQGGDDVVAKLWENNQGLINKKAREWIRSGPASLLDTEGKRDFHNDLMQQGYLAVDSAYKHYDKERGTKFTTLLDSYLKKYFYAATPPSVISIYGPKAHNQKSDEENLAIIDTISDSSDDPRTEFDNNDQKTFYLSILDSACRSERDREILHLLLIGKKPKEIAAKIRISEARVNQIIRAVTRRARATKQKIEAGK